jgi:hypothetical protein
MLTAFRLTLAAALVIGVPYLHAATITIIASDARNVSDYEQVFDDDIVTIITDGDGDQRSLPAYPWLGAGIFLTGASGQNGTARFQAEFSLAAIGGLPISSAFLVLNTDFDTNQTLNTSFYHVTTDEEGDVTVDDFQSDVAATGIVQPPVAADATHMYDVTAFVQQDVLAGLAFTSYQGRVNEAADTVFRRGVEYFSLALDPAVNDNPALRPRLVVTYSQVPEPSAMLLVASGALALVAGRRRWGRR